MEAANTPCFSFYAQLKVVFIAAFSYGIICPHNSYHIYNRLYFKSTKYHL